MSGLRIGSKNCLSVAVVGSRLGAYQQVALRAMRLFALSLSGTSGKLRLSRMLKKSLPRRAISLRAAVYACAAPNAGLSGLRRHGLSE